MTGITITQQTVLELIQKKSPEGGLPVESFIGVLKQEGIKQPLSFIKPLLDSNQVEVVTGEGDKPNCFVAL